MPKINFTYDQKAVVTLVASCEVPQEVVDEGEAAIKDYLEDHCEDWDDPGNVKETDYGETLGPDRYILYHGGV